MVNRSLVNSRLGKLREYVKILEGLTKYSLAYFKEDPLIHGSAERYLQLAIEALLDIGNHIIADRGLRKPDTYQEIFLILGEAKILPGPRPLLDAG